MDNQHLSLPDLQVVQPIQINPFQAQSMECTAAICAVYAVDLPGMDQYTSMSSYLFPTTSFARLLAIDLLNATLFYIDDMYDRNQRQVPLYGDHPTPAVYAACAKIFIDGQMPDPIHRLYPIWQELHRHFHDLSSREYRQRLVESLMQHFQAIRVPNMAFKQPKPTALESYLSTRLHDSGMYPTMLLIEFALDIAISPVVYAHPQIKRATDLAGLAAAIMNDLFSYEKEVVLLDSRFNLIRILIDTQQLSFEQAVDQTIRLINQWISEFQAIVDQAQWFADAQHNHQARAYLAGLQQQIAAAWHWQLSTNRYRSPNSPFAMLRKMLPTNHNQRIEQH
ncbi:MAG: hypothetical protein LCH85_02425 [Chloroflexi bacterium]|nr:hypothetical protein [Chloroflexota bacterium]